MTYSNEAEVKRALGIDTWRELSKDKMLTLAALMPDMDTELALKVIEQFPNFREFAGEVVEVMEGVQDATIASNERSGDQVHDALRDIRGILKGELDKGDLPWEHRRWVIEQIQETGQLQFNKDSENKRFLDSVLGKVVLGAGGIAALGLAALGGRVLEQKGPGGNS